MLSPLQRRALERAIREAQKALAEDDATHTARGSRRRLNTATLDLMRSAAHYGEWRWFGFAVRVWSSGQVRIARSAFLRALRYA